MVSWQTAVPPSACSCLSRPAICCGDQPSLTRPTTCSRRPSFMASFRRRCRRRRARSWAFRGEVAAEPSVAVAEAVAPQLAVDGGRVAAEPVGDLTDRGAGIEEPEEGAAFIEAELAVGPGQRRLRGANPCKGWGFAPRDRTHLLYVKKCIRGFMASAGRQP